MDGCVTKPLCSSSPTSLGPSLEEKLFSSCDLTANKKAHVSFKSQQPLAELGPRAKISAQFHSSDKARNWAWNPPGDLSSAFTIEMPPESPAPPPAAPTPTADTLPQTSNNGGERGNHLLSVTLSISVELTHNQRRACHLLDLFSTKPR